MSILKDVREFKKMCKCYLCLFNPNCKHKYCMTADICSYNFRCDRKIIRKYIKSRVEFYRAYNVIMATAKKHFKETGENIFWLEKPRKTS